MSNLLKAALASVKPMYNPDEGVYSLEFGPVLGVGETILEARKKFKYFFKVVWEAYITRRLAKPQELELAFTTINKNIAKYKGTEEPLVGII